MIDVVASCMPKAVNMHGQPETLKFHPGRTRTSIADQHIVEP
jgi:hypothetical protein